MKIFTIIVFVAIATIAGIFLRISWENYKNQGILLTKCWYNTLPVTVINPFCYGIYLFLMTIFCLVVNFV